VALLDSTLGELSEEMIEGDESFHGVAQNVMISPPNCVADLKPNAAEHVELRRIIFAAPRSVKCGLTRSVPPAALEKAVRNAVPAVFGMCKWTIFCVVAVVIVPSIILLAWKWPVPGYYGTGCKEGIDL